MRALILDGHSRAAAESTQALGRAGIEVVVSAEEPGAIALRSKYASDKLEQPPVVPTDDFVLWLKRQDARHRFDLIVPSTENSLLAFLGLPEEDPLRRRALLPPRLSLQITLDKGLTQEYAAQLGIPTPATRVIRSLAEVGAASDFPIVLKTARSKVIGEGEVRGFQVAIVRDEAARRSVLEDWVPRVPVLEQEYIRGWGLGIEMLYCEGKLVWYFAHERLHEWPLTGGASTYRRAIEPPVEMLEVSRRLLDSLQWHGVAMVEFRRGPGGSFVLMEVNPRLWGSLALSIDAGVNFPLGMWQIATGQRVPPQPSYRRGLRTRHLSGDLQWQKANLLANRRDPLLLLRPRLISLLELGLPLLGRERWDHFAWRDPGPLLHEFRQMLDHSLCFARHRWRAFFLLRQRQRLVKRAIARLTDGGESRPPSLLFVCQANICRSPFAALLARDRLPGFKIASAGFDRRAGRQTPSNVAEEAARMGLDMSECRSTTLADALVREADLILAMAPEHLDQLAAQFPDSRDRTVLIGLFADHPVAEIEDPNHKDFATTHRVMLQIVSAVDGLAKAITAGTRPARLPGDRRERAAVGGVSP